MARSARTYVTAAAAPIARRMRRPNVYRLDTPERVGVVFTAPSDMRVDERLFLYSLVRGFRPERALEIGVLQGGGGAIMANAMEENGVGVIIGLDPSPQLAVRPADLHGRYRVIARPSPEGIAEARAAAGGPFDFVLVDGLHQYSQVRRDIEGLLPHLADGAYVLFHDAFHFGVATAIREAVLADPALHDCGYACRTARIHHDPVTPYNGFRLLRYAASAVEDVERVVAPMYAAAGKAPPPLTQHMLDHDGWYCRSVAPCPRCRERLAAGESLARRREPASESHATIRRYRSHESTPAPAHP
jgi:predicted O-methyltransferase YrrM